MVAGRRDRNLSVKQLMISEVKEETGIDLQEEDIELLNYGQAMAISPGMTDEKIYLGLAEIKIDERSIPKLRGPAEENEKTYVLIFHIHDLNNFLCEDLKTFALIQHLGALLLKKRGRRVR